MPVSKRAQTGAWLALLAASYAYMGGQSAPSKDRLACVEVCHDVLVLNTCSCLCQLLNPRLIAYLLHRGDIEKKKAWPL